MKNTFYSYWGKTNKDATYHLLPYHCLDVAAVASRLLTQHPSLPKFFNTNLNSEQINEWITFFIALHDIGKFSDTFQQLNIKLANQLGRAYEKKEYTLRHDALGLLLWNDLLLKECLQKNWLYFTESDDKDMLRETLEFITDPAFGHHGSPVKIDERCTLEQKFTQTNQSDATNYANELANLFLSTKESTIEILWTQRKHYRKISWWLAGFISLCDWIGSNQAHFKFYSEKIPLKDYWEKVALPSAKSALESIAIWDAKTSHSRSFKELFPNISSPTPLQEKLSQIPLSSTPQLFILEDMTGAGKTEAALILTHRMITQGLGEGVYIGLPTMATTNAMYDRIKKVYRLFFSDQDLPSLVLAHGAWNLHDEFQASIWDYKSENCKEESGEISNSAYCSAWITDNRKKALLAPFGVGTIDQPLLSILISKYQALRLFGLRNKILILDEVHASDAYMHTLSRKLLEFHAAAGGSAILLSATLPQKMKQELINAYKTGLNSKINSELTETAYPLITTFSGHACEEITVETRKSVSRNLHWKLFSDKQIILDQVIQKLSEGHCAAWICNTVTDAMTLYSELKNIYPDLDIILFHARFAMGDRQDIENKVLTQFGHESNSDTRSRKLVIATQVIEQSMDLDFDWMVTDLCPIDLIIQRAGRLRRHTRKKNGDLNQDSEEARGIPELWIHSPEPTTNCTQDWYKSKFKAASFVYENHGQLWLTAQYIEEHPILHVPKDLRAAIETVFSEDSFDKIPEVLQNISDKSDGKNRSKSQMATWNSISLNSGYSAHDGNWQDDIYAPTRLSDQKTITIRLAKWQDEKLEPWINNSNEKKAWALSEVSISESKISKEAPQEKALEDAIKKLKESWPGKPEFYFVLALIQDEKSKWIGKAINKKEELVSMQYSPKIGVSIYE